MAANQIWVSPGGNNSNSGSASAPLKTIQAALNKASSGMDVMVKAGTYTENLRISDNNLSLISADGNQKAIIKAANQYNSTISGFGVENVKVRGFEIDGASHSNGIHFGMSGSGFSDPIRNLTIQDNKIHSSGQDGVKVSQAHNVTVVHNAITGTGGEGIDFVAVNGSKITGNMVTGVNGTAGIMVKGGSSNNEIVNNKVSDAKVNGISVGGWTTEKWMWPDAHGYEAKNIKVTGNEVSDVNKSAILVSGAHDSHIANNHLHPNNSYDAVIWLDSSTSDHPKPIYSKNITLSGNIVERDDWLRINGGNNDGVKVSGNKVSAGYASGTKGASDSAKISGAVDAASGSAADQKTAVVEGKVEDHHLTGTAPATRVVTPDKAIGAGSGDHSGLVVNTGGESIVYSHIREAEARADGTAHGTTAGADAPLYFRLPADTAASDTLTKWQTLEDATAHADTAVAADQSHIHQGHTQGTQTHANDHDWLL